MKYIYITLSTVILLIVLTFCLLQFGNPQWHKSIFIFQAYYFNGEYEIAYPGVPEDFDGVWREWFEDGTSFAQVNYVKGVKHGMRKFFYENGQLYFIDDYHNGLHEGFSVIYEETGFRAYACQYHDGYITGVLISYGTLGEVKTISYRYPESKGKTGIQLYDIRDETYDDPHLDRSGPIKYAKEIKQFKSDLKAFEEEHGIK